MYPENHVMCHTFGEVKKNTLDYSFQVHLLPFNKCEPCKHLFEVYAARSAQQQYVGCALGATSELAVSERDMAPCPHGASQYKYDECHKNRSHGGLGEGIVWRTGSTFWRPEEDRNELQVWWEKGEGAAECSARRERNVLRLKKSGMLGLESMQEGWPVLR